MVSFELNIIEASEIHTNEVERGRHQIVRTTAGKLFFKKGRTKLAEKAGITEKLILKWTNHADLFRIKEVGGEYAELLEAAGVDTVPELAKRKADNLAAKMAGSKRNQKTCEKDPAPKQVGYWIEQAGKLPRIMQY